MLLCALVERKQRSRAATGAVLSNPKASRPQLAPRQGKRSLAPKGEGSPTFSLKSPSSRSMSPRAVMNGCQYRFLGKWSLLPSVKISLVAGNAFRHARACGAPGRRAAGAGGHPTPAAPAVPGSGFGGPPGCPLAFWPCFAHCWPIGRLSAAFDTFGRLWPTFAFFWVRLAAFALLAPFWPPLAILDNFFCALGPFGCSWPVLDTSDCP